MPLIVTPRLLRQRSDFYHQFASLLTAGVGLLQALEMIGRKPPARHFRQPLGHLTRAIEQGSTLTEAITRLHRWVPDFDLALIGAAERSGRLPEAFRLLGGYYGERAQLTSRVIGRLLYPAFILHFAILIFPTGELVDLVRTGGVLAFAVSKLRVLLPLYAAAVVVIVASQGSLGEGWRSLVEALLRWIPVLGSARRDLALARLSASLGALITAGVPVLEAWDLAAAASGSPALKREVASWKPRLQAGLTPGELLDAGSAFPELFSSLYQTAESSGRLDETLDRLQHHYQEAGAGKLHGLAFWVPFLLYLGIVFFIAVQIIGFWSNYSSAWGD